MSQTELDFLIVGQGLAGSLLAWQLHLGGFNIRITRDPEYSGASPVAAGMINPVTGLRLALSAQIDPQLHAASQLYNQIEQVFSVQVFQPRRIARLFRNTQEQHYYDKRHNQARFNKYLGRPFGPDTQDFPVRHELGGFYIRQGGYLDTVTCIDTLASYFHEHQLILNTVIRYDDLVITSDHVQWQDYQVRQVIFCEGARMLKNPWFNWLPMQALHGDILTVSGPDIQNDAILSFGHWLLPLQGSRYRFGASMHPGRDNPEPDHDSGMQLLDELNASRNTTRPFSLLSHQAGVRPATRDRMPFVGIHPQFESLAIFNGFGSKGSLTIPYFVSAFIKLLTRQIPLDPESDIRRYQERCPDV